MLRSNLKKIVVGGVTLTGIGLYGSKMIIEGLEEEFLKNPKNMKKMLNQVNFSSEAIEPILELRRDVIKISKNKSFGENSQKENGDEEFLKAVERYEKNVEINSKKFYKKLGIPKIYLGLKINFIKFHNPDLFKNLENNSQLLYDYALNGNLESFEKAISSLELKEKEILENKILAENWNRMVNWKTKKCFESLENYFILKNDGKIDVNELTRVYLKDCDMKCPVLELSEFLKNEKKINEKFEGLFDPVVLFFASRRVYEENENLDEEVFLDFYQDSLRFEILEINNLIELKNLREKYLSKLE